jgi:tRNA G18 (ribose-2'-O)-methylase SpoU
MECGNGIGHHIKMKVSNNKPLIVGKTATPIGVVPAVCLINPKYSANVGAIQRAASCFDVKQVWYTGSRIKLEEGGTVAS